MRERGRIETVHSPRGPYGVGNVDCPETTSAHAFGCAAIPPSAAKPPEREVNRREIDQSGTCRIPPGRDDRSAWGFTLVEVLMALTIVAIGLLAVGQEVTIGMSSASLARSKAAGALTAQSKLDQLENLYNRDPENEALSRGSHGPEPVETMDPAEGRLIARSRVDWEVNAVPDPRPGRVLEALQVTVTVKPANRDDTLNVKTGMNKTVTITSILGRKVLR